MSELWAQCPGPESPQPALQQAPFVGSGFPFPIAQHKELLIHGSAVPGTGAGPEPQWGRGTSLLGSPWRSPGAADPRGT